MWGGGGDQLLLSWREKSGYWRGHAIQLPTTIVTRFCGHREFLRRLGHDKSRVRILYPKPDGILYYYFVPTSDVACVETGINTIRNRTKMCTHPTGGSPQYVPKPRLRYDTYYVCIKEKKNISDMVRHTIGAKFLNLEEPILYIIVQLGLQFFRLS